MTVEVCALADMNAAERIWKAQRASSRPQPSTAQLGRGTQLKKDIFHQSYLSRCDSVICIDLSVTTSNTVEDIQHKTILHEDCVTSENSRRKAN